MKIAIEIDWQRKRFTMPRERIQLADRIGYDMVFSAESNGSDGISVLGYVLGCTERIGVGTRIAQTVARTPAALAMAYLTLKHMAPERTVIAGIGSSNPRQTEGWHGFAWDPPHGRMQDYVTLFKQAFNGQPLQIEGKTINVPYREPGQPPKWPPNAPILEPEPDIPIMFGGGTELMTTLAAEIADGILPNGSWSPGMMKVYRPMIEKGFARRKNPPKIEDFPLWAHVDVLVTDDVKAAIWQFKEYTARYAGGWFGKGGLATHMQWRGYGEALARIQELYQAGRIKEAEEAVPDEYVDECWLLGPMDRILERWRSKWINDGCNLIVRTDNWPSARPANNEVYAPLLKALLD